MSQRTQTGPMESWEGSSKPMGIIKKMEGKSSKEGISKWGWCKSQQTPK